MKCSSTDKRHTGRVRYRHQCRSVLTASEHLTMRAMKFCSANRTRFRLLVIVATLLHGGTTRILVAHTTLASLPDLLRHRPQINLTSQTL